MRNNQSAIIGGGGANLYRRLLNDSTDNLLRPTAQMINKAYKTNSQALSNSFYSRQNTATGGKSFSNSRQLVSANMQSGRPGRSNKYKKMYSGNANARAYSSHAYRGNQTVSQNFYQD